MAGEEVAGGEARGAAPAVSPYLLLLLPPLFWAGNFVIGRAMHAAIPPVAFCFWRWVVALALLLPLAGTATLRRWPAVVRSWRLLTLLSVSGVVLIMAIIPAAIPVVAYALDRSRLAARQAVGIAVSLLGVAVVMLHGDIARLRTLTFGEGDLWVAAAVPAWAVYSVLVKRRPVDLPPLVLLLATVVIGIVLLLPAYLWERAVSGDFAVTPASVAALLYVGAFASAIAFLCWNRGVAAVGAHKAGPFIHLMPVFGSILAVLFLGERPVTGDIAGIALIAAGLLLSSTARSA
jgi:drug/metabolite transporter (DMT)-like permease